MNNSQWKTDFFTNFLNDSNPTTATATWISIRREVFLFKKKKIMTFYDDRAVAVHPSYGRFF